MPTLCELAGGSDALHRLAHAFYGRVFQDELLTTLFHEPGADHHADRLGMWLVELCGGESSHELAGTPEAGQQACALDVARARIAVG